MITTEIKQFLDRAEVSLNALDSVFAQVEVTLVEARHLMTTINGVLQDVAVLVKRLKG
jgi:uncharacterized protein YoxC